MKFHSDDYFHIGHEHVVAGKPCQDYALSGLSGGVAYATVSDGCSTGGNTDVGARLVALSAAKAIHTLGDAVTGPKRDYAVEAIVFHQQTILNEVKTLLSVTRNDMLATCLYAVVSERGGFVHVRGDGVVAFVKRNGSILLHRFDWANNTPFYPEYLNDDVSSFVEAHGGVEDAHALTEEKWLLTNNECKHISTTTHSIAHGMGGMLIDINQEVVKNELAYVAVFTDGVEAVDGMDWKEAAAHLLDLKNRGGVFAKRRMIRFVTKEATARGVGPSDDIAYAAIRVEHESQGGAP